MAISYSGIIGNKGKGTLPSVESWASDNNILRDPPKSITTRRIDKVNEDGSLNEMLYHSGDRFAENINVYARGVNPFVSVEYGNIGTAGNGNTGSGSFSGAMGKNPYRILDRGAFRPPILRMEQLYPLSRQPRLVTQCFTNKEFIDYTKKVQCPQGPEAYRQVRNETLKSFITPTKTVKFQQPVKEHFEVKYVIAEPIHANTFVNKSSKANIQIENQNPLRQAEKEVLQYAYTAGKKGDGTFQNYIHDEVELTRNLPEYMNTTNRSSTFKTTLAAEHSHLLERNLPSHHFNGTKVDNNNFKPLYSNVNPEDLNLTRNVPEHKIISQKSSNQNFTRLDEDGEIILERNLPEHNIVSNSSNNRTYIHFTPDNELSFESKLNAMNVVANVSSKRADTDINRDVFVPPSLNVGGFENQGVRRSQERNVNFNVDSSRSTQKRTMAKSVMEGILARDTGSRGVRH